jgi:hypothetical protein
MMQNKIYLLLLVVLLAVIQITSLDSYNRKGTNNFQMIITKNIFVVQVVIKMMMTVSKIVLLLPANIIQQVMIGHKP